MHTRDTAVYASFWNLTECPIMAFLMLDWRQIFDDILFEFLACYECFLTLHCDFLNQTFKKNFSGLFKYVTSNENTYRCGESPWSKVSFFELNI